ncbi:MAG: YjbF family lipoprotein [Pseudomonadota bacterium]|nr:YjbF family lipoprotein [Pseudomonadota bacterium]
MNILIIISFVSCSAIDTNRIAPGYGAAFNSIKLAIFGDNNEIDTNLIANIPYASMLVKIGKGPTALMILEGINGDEYTWVSADGVYLVLKEGKIIKTKGLPNNLFSRFDPPFEWDQNLYQKTFTSYLSFRNPRLDNLKVTSIYHENGSSNIELVFSNKYLQLVEEKIESEIIAWSQTNQYWIDNNNFVWKSTQYISPKLPPIHYRVAKKPQ